MKGMFNVDLKKSNKPKQLEKVLKDLPLEISLEGLVVASHKQNDPECVVYKVHAPCIHEEGEPELWEIYPFKYQHPNRELVPFTNQIYTLLYSREQDPRGKFRFISTWSPYESGMGSFGTCLNFYFRGFEFNFIMKNLGLDTEISEA